MIAADELNFDNGEYVFISIDLFARSVSLLRIQVISGLAPLL